jgi:hypothetical protein
VLGTLWPVHEHAPTNTEDRSVLGLPRSWFRLRQMIVG